MVWIIVEGGGVSESVSEKPDFNPEITLARFPATAILKTENSANALILLGN